MADLAEGGARARRRAAPRAGRSAGRAGPRGRGCAQRARGCSRGAARPAASAPPPHPHLRRPPLLRCRACLVGWCPSKREGKAAACRLPGRNGRQPISAARFHSWDTALNVGPEATREQLGQRDCWGRLRAKPTLAASRTNPGGPRRRLTLTAGERDHPSHPAAEEMRFRSGSSGPSCDGVLALWWCQARRSVAAQPQSPASRIQEKMAPNLAIRSRARRIVAYSYVQPRFTAASRRFDGACTIHPPAGAARCALGAELKSLRRGAGERIHDRLLDVSKV